MTPRLVTSPSREVDRPDTWVELHGDHLFRFAMHRVGDASDAEELVQETMLAALKGVDRYDGRAAFRTWLISILRHKIADHFRRSPRDAECATGRFERWYRSLFDDRDKWRAAPCSWKTWPESSEERDELTSVLRGCLSHLTPATAEAFVLREQHDVPLERLAAAIGITPGNLAVRLHRALGPPRLSREELVSSGVMMGDSDHVEAAVVPDREPRACRRATILISVGADRRLTRRERLSLGVHLFVCRQCRRFRGQIRQIGAFMRDQPGETFSVPLPRSELSPPARSRITQALQGSSRD